jgi:phosphoribosylanthranilate isomerase
MKLKVCGMKDPVNIRQLSELKPDWMGLIFYSESPRFPALLNPSDIEGIDTPRVGVFVNEELDKMLDTVDLWQLDYVQLHGDETLDYINQAKSSGVKVIKAIRVKDQLPPDIDQYRDKVDMLLFDTKKKATYGGTGERFDWEILNSYHLEVPYLISGGIEIGDIEKIKSMSLRHCVGVDINSKVEIRPGIKDIRKIKELKERL